MTFFEKELHKILDKVDGYNFVYISNSAYLKLQNVKIRIDISNSFSVDHYDSILLTAMKNDSGVIDRKTIKFAELWGKLPTNNPNFSNGVSPHIWKWRDEIDWYVAKPNEKQYKMLSEEIRKYIMVFE